MKKELRKLFKFLSAETHAKYRCYKRLGYWPNFKTPTTFNEKIHYRKFHMPRESSYGDFVCKYKVREFIRSKLGEEYLIPLLYVGDTVTESQLRELGDDIVIKTSHDSGTVHIVSKNSDINYKDILRDLDKSLHKRFGKETSEWWYNDCDPKIIVEKKLKGSGDQPPKDYKFHVFRHDEDIKIILQVDYDRFSGHHRTLYNEKGEVLDVSIKENNKFIEFESPSNFNEMLSVATKLSEGFDYVRIDLYSVGDAIFFGEMTFAPGGGFQWFLPAKYDEIWGSYWQLKI
jgi:hypothetical protein